MKNDDDGSNTRRASRAVSRTALGLCLAVCAIAASGCTMPLEEEGVAPEEVLAKDLPIENGQKPWTNSGNGVVRLLITGTGGEVRICSGQIVSRDSILTAAHCIYNRGYYDSGYQSSVNVPVEVTLERPDGSRDVVTPWGHGDRFEVKAFVKRSYVDAKDAGVTQQRGYDVAILQASNNFRNITSEDAAGISRAADSRPSFMRLYGYGEDQDGGTNGRLHTGHFDNLTWYTSSSPSYHKSFKSTYWYGDAHACLGDSGGPFKLGTPDQGLAGIVFGVYSGGGGSDSGDCTDDYARGTAVGYHDKWMEDKIQRGLGSCSREERSAYYVNGSLRTFNTLVCW